jgi:retinol dehydrogenase-12
MLYTLVWCTLNSLATLVSFYCACHQFLFDTLHFLPGIFKFVWWIPARFFAKNPTEGTQTSIQCAVAKELAQETGKYYADCKEKEPRSQAKDDVVARKLWDLSVKAVKLDE